MRCRICSRPSGPVEGAELLSWFGYRRRLSITCQGPEGVLIGLFAARGTHSKIRPTCSGFPSVLDGCRSVGFVLGCSIEAVWGPFISRSLGTSAHSGSPIRATGNTADAPPCQAESVARSGFRDAMQRPLSGTGWGAPSGELGALGDSEYHGSE